MTVLHAKMEDAELDALVEAYDREPETVCERLRVGIAEFGADVQEMHEAEEKIRAAWAAIAQAAAVFEANLPVRSSMFRGGEDSRKTYRVLCPFLRRLEAERGTLRALVGTLSACRDRLSAAMVCGIKAEAACFFLLRHVADCGGTNGELLSLHAESKRKNTQIKEDLQSVNRLLAQISSFDRDVIARFLQAVTTLSDALHDGENCDCTGVISLVSALKRQTEQSAARGKE